MRWLIMSDQSKETDVFGIPYEIRITHDRYKEQEEKIISDFADWMQAKADKANMTRVRGIRAAERAILRSDRETGDSDDPAIVNIFKGSA
jgi:hypothetical protein